MSSLCSKHEWMSPNKCFTPAEVAVCRRVDVGRGGGLGGRLGGVDLCRHRRQIGGVGSEGMDGMVGKRVVEGNRVVSA